MCGAGMSRMRRYRGQTALLLSSFRVVCRSLGSGSHTQECGSDTGLVLFKKTVFRAALQKDHAAVALMPSCCEAAHGMSSSRRIFPYINTLLSRPHPLCDSGVKPKGAV